MPKTIALCAAVLLALSACGGPSSAPKTAEAGAAKSAAQGVITPPGSRVSLWLPEGTVRPMRLQVFINEKSGVSIGIGEMTGMDEKGAAEMLEGAASALDEQGLKSRSPISRDGASGYMAQGEAQGMVMKALLLRKGVAVANVSAQYQADSGPIAEKVLESIRLNDQATLDPLLMHGIRIGDLQGLEVWPVASHPIVLREPGSKPPYPPEAPSFALMVLPYEKPNPSDEDLGRAMGGLIANLQPDAKEAKQREFQLDGLPAFEIIAPGKKAGAAILVYSFMARGKDSALAGFGHVGKARGAEFMSRFAALTGSIKLTDSILGPVAR